MIADVSAEIISSAATIIVAVVGLVAVIIKQNRQGRRIEKVYDHVNRGEVEMGVGEPRTFREEMRDGFARNDTDHTELKASLGDHERRITHVEREVGP